MKLSQWILGCVIVGALLLMLVVIGVLCVGVGFLLGLVTGRIQVPASIIIPIYLGSTGFEAMTPWPFVITYISIFLGYVISPVHPCISVSLEYFNVGLKDFLKKMFWPAMLALLTAMFVAVFVFL